MNARQQPRFLSGVTERLAAAPPAFFGAWAIAAAFGTYFSMYAFRKPFAVGTFDGDVAIPIVGLLGYKVVLIVSQVLGYTASKFMGIKVISEMTPGRRAFTLLGVIGFAHASLLGFAVTPAPWAALFLFMNGLPLGMVWGLTFGFLEGRRTSEALGAGLSASYIVASGVVKSVGRAVMSGTYEGTFFGVDVSVPMGWFGGWEEAWMPFITGLLFVPFLVLFVGMLYVLPPPSPEDIEARTERVPMDAEARRAFFTRYMPGLLPLTGLYILLTAYRDFRDNFARELWDALGYGGESAIYATSEFYVAVGVMVALAALMAIRSNRAALIAVHGVMLLGTLGVGASTFAFQAGALSGETWMILVGLGLYLAYVPYGCVLFDRLIAAVGVSATAGFLIYVTDAFGYLGSVCLLLYKEVGSPDLSWLQFFITVSYVTSAVCSALFVVSAVYFARETRPIPQ